MYYTRGQGHRAVRQRVCFLKGEFIVGETAKDARVAMRQSRALGIGFIGVCRADTAQVRDGVSQGQLLGEDGVSENSGTASLSWSRD